MPPPRPCAIPGCPHDSAPGTPRCADHQRQHRQRTASNTPRQSAHRRGYDTRWRRTRHSYLRRHPHCECQGCRNCQHVTPDSPRCIRPPTDVDHINNIGPLHPRGHHDDELQALCHECHSTKTATEDGGFGHTN